MLFCVRVRASLSLWLEITVSLRRVWCMRQLCGAFVVALVACGGGRETPTEGRGTAACRIWQDSVCDWAVRCQAALSRGACDDQFRGVTCRSDAKANACSKQFDSAGCQTLPPNCGLDEVADPAPAAKACDALTDLICERSVSCGQFETEEACVNEAKIDCSRSIAFTLDYEQCIADVKKLDCDVLVVPEICDSVIIATAQSTGP
jgi:hypothetical protein